MFSGIQEILLILLIVLAIVFLPRITGRRQTPVDNGRGRHGPYLKLSGPLRLAILGSIAWLFLTAVYFEPWHRALPALPLRRCRSGGPLLGHSLDCRRFLQTPKKTSRLKFKLTPETSNRFYP